MYSPEIAFKNSNGNPEQISKDYLRRFLNYCLEKFLNEFLEVSVYVSMKKNL